MIQANRRLATTLDGVYRRGEFYMRWLQRLSSLAFGTRPGRFLTRYVALPFGGAFVLLEGLQHLIEPVLRLLRGEVPTADEEVAEAAHDGLHLLNAYSLLGVGLFLMALLYLPAFRRAVGQGLLAAWRVMRAVLIDMPAAVLRQPMVRRVLDSVPYLLFHRLVLKPLLVTVVVWELCWLLQLRPLTRPLGTAGLFLTACAFLNSRPGRNLEELIADWGMRSWHRLSADLLPGLFRFVMSLFKQFVDAVELLLYTVDEWLRFRSGNGKATLIAKTALGFLWFFVSYVIRFCINLLIEPQINPIKHFPVVTVSHKLVMTMGVPPMTSALLTFGMQPVEAGATAAAIGTGIPGIFGFLVWELKENWRLYRANQPPALGPLVIGRHGETMAGLLLPGFHSGTLPRLYARLRRAERRAYRGGSRRAVRKQREALHHLEESVRHFVEREFLVLLNESKRWNAGRVTAGPVELGSNRIAVALCCPGLGPDSLELVFEEQSGWLLAHVAHPGWLAKVPADEQSVFASALAGLYKMSAIDLVREQIAACLGPSSPPYDITDEGLVVWPGKGYEAEVVYELRNGDVMLPRVTAGDPPKDMPALQALQLFFNRVVIPWKDWCEAWERDQTGNAPETPLVAEVALLPGAMRAY